MTDKDFEKHLISLRELQNSRNTVYSDWLKNIVTIATGLLAVLVSLKTTKSANELEHYLYVCSIGFIGLGILLGVIILFSDIKVANLSISKKKEQLESLLDGSNKEFDFINRPKIYKYLEYICFSCFTLALISLVIYAIITDI
jgi:hypothetical protein